MKKYLIIVAVLLAAFNASAAGHVGQCVYPITKQLKDGRLEFKKPVYITSAPNATDGQILKSLSAFTITAENNGIVELTTVPDYSKPDADKYAGKVIGWAKLSDFKFQDLRNCN